MTTDAISFYSTDPCTNRGRLVFASLRPANDLTKKIIVRYEQGLESVNAIQGESEKLTHLENIDSRFPDGEIHVRLEEDIRGADVYLVQTPAYPDSQSDINQNYLAFFIAAYGIHQAGANSVTAVLPYWPYARQEKATDFEREPITARLLADCAVAAQIKHLITFHPHVSPQGLYGSIKVDALDSLSMAIDHYKAFAGRNDVIVVAADAGASGFVNHLCAPDVLNLGYAIAEKHRPGPGDPIIPNVIGDLGGKKIAIVPDDMISTAGTMYTLIKKLVTENEIEEVYISASHNLCLNQAYERLIDLHENYHLKEVVVTNSIPQSKAFLDLPFLRVKCLSGILALTINAIHYNHSVSAITRTLRS